MKVQSVNQCRLLPLGGAGGLEDQPTDLHNTTSFLLELLSLGRPVD